MQSNSKVLDLLPPYAEYVYNKAPRKTYRKSLFKVLYGTNPLSSLDHVLRVVDEKPSAEASKRVKEIQKLYKQVTTRIEKSNFSYQAQANKHKKRRVCQPRDLVCIHLRKECFPS